MLERKLMDDQMPGQSLAPVVDSPVVALLKKGRARIATGYCKGRFYINTAGQHAGWDSNAEGSASAVAWCARGAIDHFHEHNSPESNAAYGLLMDALPAHYRFSSFGGEVPGYNNHPKTTQADILALFDRAIAAASA